MIAPARRAAFRILLQIDTSDAHSDDLLRAPEIDALSAPDRHLTTMLVLGTLRWQLALDAQIRSLLARPEAKLSAEAATALRLGAYQLLHLDRVPPHAVLHDSVELVKRSQERGAAGMVNAVLRKIQGSGLRAQRAEIQKQSLGSQDHASAAAIAACWAHPAWMVERWARFYGLDAAEAICRWDQEPAALTVRAEPDAVFSGMETEPGAFLTGARRIVSGGPGYAEALRTGQIRIQDEASQLVAEVLAAQAGPDPRAMRVLDLCAAPGGKTAVLAERLPGAEITAVDVSRKRVLAARAERFPGRGGAEVRWEVADATRMELQPVYDRILCDVPCSGTGTLARNPEIRLRAREADLARQQQRQIAILRTGLAGLKPGGRLVYSTCSLEPEENEQVVEAVLRGSTGIRVVPADMFLDSLAAQGRMTEAGRERLRSAVVGRYLRTIPGIHRCDGFFAAVLERDTMDPAVAD